MSDCLLVVSSYYVVCYMLDVLLICGATAVW